MSTDVEDLMKRITLHPGDNGGPSYMQMLREREEAAAALEAQAKDITHLVDERDALKAEVERLKGELQEPANVGDTYQIEHDGFEGEVIGSYRTREGKEGVVLQQIGTRVVHVYGRKWIEK